MQDMIINKPVSDNANRATWPEPAIRTQAAALETGMSSRTLPVSPCISTQHDFKHVARFRMTLLRLYWLSCKSEKQAWNAREEGVCRWEGPADRRSPRCRASTISWTQGASGPFRKSSAATKSLPVAKAGRRTSKNQACHHTSAPRPDLRIEQGKQCGQKRQGARSGGEDMYQSAQPTFTC